MLIAVLTVGLVVSALCSLAWMGAFSALLFSRNFLVSA